MKKLLRSPVISGFLFLLAAALLVVGTVGGVQAALTIFSDKYLSGITLNHIGVALLENGSEVAYRTYGDSYDSGWNQQQDGQIKLNSLGSDKEVLIGKQYDCEITAQNTGTIDEYVRVTIRKYWVEEASSSDTKGYIQKDDGTKIVDEVYDPGYIILSYQGTTDSYNSGAWYKDPGASTDEREVYYYKGILAQGGATAALFDKLAISGEVTKDAVVTVEQNGNVTKTTYTYAYDGYGFVIEATVDAVQTHNARPAMQSAWGTSASVMNAIGVPAGS